MATFTSNYNLNKIETMENSLNVIFTEGNSNLDLIDGLIKTQETSLQNHISNSNVQYVEITNAETIRNTNENGRIQAETDRVTADGIREVNHNQQMSEVSDIKTEYNLATQANTNIAITSKIKTYVFTATVNGTTNITFPLIFDVAHDDLLCFDQYYGSLLYLGDNYSLNANGVSIDLLSWSLNLNEKIKFILYKSVK